MPAFRWATPYLSVLALILIWGLTALVLNSRYLPAPVEVAKAIVDEARSGALSHHVGATALRVTAAFVIAMLAGAAIGIGLGRNSSANRFFDPWLVFALNIPALVTIVFCYLWIGLTEVAAIVAVALNKIPNVAITLREGARALDPGLKEVADSFRISPAKQFKNVVWPQLEPYVAAAVRSGLALIWKIVLVVELLGRSNGVGFQINLYFGMFDLTRILAYSLTFMFLVWLVEAWLVKPWERRATRWRGAA